MILIKRINRDGKGDYNFIIIQSLIKDFIKIKDIIFSNIIYDIHYRRLVGSRNIFVRELIARTDLSAVRRQTTRQNSAVLSELYRD